MSNMYNKKSVWDPIVYVIILAYSIMDFAHLRYASELDDTTSILCLIFNVVAPLVIYHYIKLLSQKFLKPEVQYIWKNIRKIEKKKENEMDRPDTVVAQAVPVVAVIEDHDDKESSVNEGEILEQHFRYAMHYIGSFISEEDADNLKWNIKELAYSDNPRFKQVSRNKLGEYVEYDLLHLCHAIGNHTLRNRSIYEIAEFAKQSFQNYFAESSIKSLSKKLTYTEYAKQRIKVCSRKDQFPIF